MIVLSMNPYANTNNNSAITAPPYCYLLSNSNISLREEAITDENLRYTANDKPADNFNFVFSKALEYLIIDRMEQEDTFARFIDAQEFILVISESLLR